MVLITPAGLVLLRHGVRNPQGRQLRHKLLQEFEVRAQGQIAGQRLRGRVAPVAIASCVRRPDPPHQHMPSISSGHLVAALHSQSARQPQPAIVEKPHGADFVPIWREGTAIALAPAAPEGATTRALEHTPRSPPRRIPPQTPYVVTRDKHVLDGPGHRVRAAFAHVGNKQRTYPCPIGLGSAQGRRRPLVEQAARGAVATLGGLGLLVSVRASVIYTVSIYINTVMHTRRKRYNCSGRGREYANRMICGFLLVVSRSVWGGRTWVELQASKLIARYHRPSESTHGLTGSYGSCLKKFGLSASMNWGADQLVKVWSLAHRSSKGTALGAAHLTPVPWHCLNPAHTCPVTASCVTNPEQGLSHTPWPSGPMPS